MSDTTQVALEIIDTIIYMIENDKFINYVDKKDKTNDIYNTWCSTSSIRDAIDFQTATSMITQLQEHNADMLYLLRKDLLLVTA